MFTVPAFIRRPSDHKRYRQFLNAVFAAETPESLESHINELVTPSPYRIRVKVLYAPNPASGALDALNRTGRVEPNSGGIGFLYSPAPRERGDETTPIPFAMLETKYPRTALLVAVCERP